MGNVARNAITLGDVDNDGCNELIIGNTKGEVAIFKGRERIQKIIDLTFVSCVAVGDIFNKQKNSLVIVTTDGWCYIYETVDNHSKQTEETEKTDEELSQVLMVRYSLEKTWSTVQNQVRVKLRRMKISN
jgi:hypothetical protein